MFTLRPEEEQLLNLLGEAWNQFCALPREHPADAQEFAETIHRLQDMVAARPVWRATRWKRANTANKN